MIFLCIVLMIAIPAFVLASILASLFAVLETIASQEEIEQEERDEEGKLNVFLGDDVVMVCPKCDNIREGTDCPKCKVKLVTIDEYEQTW